MRLFVACSPSKETIRSLSDYQNKLKAKHIGGNYTSAGNMHITLAFIGEIDNYADIVKALNSVKFSSFSLSFGLTGSFGSLWWASPELDDRLNALARNVREALKNADIPFDTKPFKAHITLLRKPEYSGGLPGDITLDRTESSIDKFSLYKSERGRFGMIYTPIASFKAEN